MGSAAPAGRSHRVDDRRRSGGEGRRRAEDPGLRITFAGGNRIAVAGVPQRPATRSKIIRAVAEWGGLVEIAPDVSYIQSEAGSRTQDQRKALPIRFAMLNAGPTAYIETDRRARYFVGSTLPDGSVVTSIDANRVVVEAAGKPIEYRLVN